MLVKMESLVFEDYLACCGSTKFAQEIVSNGPFSTYNESVEVARDIWFNKVPSTFFLIRFEFLFIFRILERV